MAISLVDPDLLPEGLAHAVRFFPEIRRAALQGVARVSPVVLVHHQQLSRAYPLLVAHDPTVLFPLAHGHHDTAKGGRDAPQERPQAHAILRALLLVQTQRTHEAQTTARRRRIPPGVELVAPADGFRGDFAREPRVRVLLSQPMSGAPALANRALDVLTHRLDLGRLLHGHRAHDGLATLAGVGVAVRLRDGAHRVRFEWPGCRTTLRV